MELDECPTAPLDRLLQEIQDSVRQSRSLILRSRRLVIRSALLTSLECHRCGRTGVR